jgi:hypothetical protein
VSVTWLFRWSVSDTFVLRDFGPCGIVRVFTKVCAVTTVAMVMLLRDFEAYGIMFMTV